MAERSADNITNIVRRLMGAISNLPTNPNEVDSIPSSVHPTAGRSFLGVQLELNDRFQILRACRQPLALSRLGELFQRLDRVVLFPMQQETLGGRRRVNRTTKSSLRTFACYLIPNGVVFQGVQ